MKSFSNKTPEKEERDELRAMLRSANKALEESKDSAKKALEASEERTNTVQRQLKSVLERYLDDEEKNSAADDQQPENLESKMDEALDHDEPVRLSFLNEPDVAQQEINEASERSALRPSRRDTNSPKEFTTMAC